MHSVLALSGCKVRKSESFVLLEALHLHGSTSPRLSTRPGITFNLPIDSPSRIEFSPCRLHEAFFICRDAVLPSGLKSSRLIAG